MSSSEPFTNESARPPTEQERPFLDREDAGRRLAEVLARFHGAGTVVLGIPRGGAVVAAHVARRLDARLDVWIARKIGAPGNPELGIGAVGEGGALVVDPGLCAVLGIDAPTLLALAEQQRTAVAERVTLLRRGVAPPQIRGRVVILVDDGIATGVTVRAAIHDMQARGALRVVVATPVGAVATLDRLEAECDEVVALLRVANLGAVGRYYDEFEQVSDDTVAELLHPLP
ncbi:MAG TPA: phosphoribosyltransferase family protein [Myxococcota bacterium]